MEVQIREERRMEVAMCFPATRFLLLPPATNIMQQQW